MRKTGQPLQEVSKFGGFTLKGPIPGMDQKVPIRDFQVSLLVGQMGVGNADDSHGFNALTGLRRFGLSASSGRPR
jgi:hypothetical protein